MGALEWAVANRAAPGEQVCGDAWIVRPGPAQTLVAVADGLGHGPDAEASARAALEAIAKAEGSPAQRLATAHEQVRRTRGSAVGVAQIGQDSGELRWVGVGNVEAVVLRRLDGRLQRKRLYVNAGLLGHRLPALRESSLELAEGDLLVVVTDGVEEAFADAVNPSDDLERTAAEGLTHHARGTDDATILIARFMRSEGALR